jgi:hypothetical protein
MQQNQTSLLKKYGNYFLPVMVLTLWLGGACAVICRSISGHAFLNLIVAQFGTLLFIYFVMYSVLE